ncbi:hypothetical protein CEXT_494221 [Caerostris extrusa]|uniref:Uncharacterized protein n=1 Tax=Caerostris extrusa TaxID=172846 RepID=A0AAV4YC88_CAEEX|nr:hypothetical protein CEXT_494221 [Caerostris extrusa]
MHTHAKKHSYNSTPPDVIKSVPQWPPQFLFQLVKQFGERHFEKFEWLLSKQQGVLNAVMSRHSGYKQTFETVSDMGPGGRVSGAADTRPSPSRGITRPFTACFGF